MVETEDRFCCLRGTGRWDGKWRSRRRRAAGSRSPSRPGERGRSLSSSLPGNWDLNSPALRQCLGGPRAPGDLLKDQGRGPFTDPTARHRCADHRPHRTRPEAESSRDSPQGCGHESPSAPSSATPAVAGRAPDLQTLRPSSKFLLVISSEAS